MRTPASLMAVIVCVPSLLSCVGMLMSTQGRSDRDTALDSADTGTAPAGSCSEAETADFIGYPPGAVSHIEGARESEGLTTSDEATKVLLDVTLSADQLDEAWFAYDGVCWVAQSGPAVAIALTVGQETVSASGQANVFTPSSDVMLDLTFTVPEALLGGEADALLDVHVIRSMSTEEGRIHDASGEELVRW